MEEQWKKIPEFELYEVSNLGKVRRLSNNGKPPKAISVKSQNNQPYLMFGCCIKAKVTKLYLHRILAQLWLPNPNPEEFIDVCFRDGNKKNVTLENIYWSNQDQRMKRRQIEGGYLGMDGSRKLNEEEVREIRSIWKAKQATQKQISEMFGLHPWTIWCVCNNKTWKHVK
jgi:hypothetical protein